MTGVEGSSMDIRHSSPGAGRPSSSSSGSISSSNNTMRITNEGLPKRTGDRIQPATTTPNHTTNKPDSSNSSSNNTCRNTSSKPKSPA